MLAITLLAILVSLTRTLLIAAVLGLVIAIVARELSRPDFGRVARRVGTIVLAAVVVVVGFSRIVPAYWGFLLKRLSEFTSAASGGTQVTELAPSRDPLGCGREGRGARRHPASASASRGPGPITVDPDYYHWTSDMTWLPIMYLFGYVGLLLFGLLLAGFMARALWLSLKPPELRRELCLAYFITLALTVVMSFQMWTFMQPTVYPMGLWILALIAVEALRPAEEPTGCRSRRARRAQSRAAVTAVGPRITFGIIVLNGEPFTRYCLRSLYPFAHEIIVVEGGHENALDVSTPDGHSTDATLEALYRFKAEEDPEDKVQIVVRDGPWPQKDELGNSKTPQSRAYAERATGDYLWQVDIDEFYRPEDMRAVLDMLAGDPGITAVSFNVHPFWGALPYVSDGWYWRRGQHHLPPPLQVGAGLPLRHPPAADRRRRPRAQPAHAEVGQRRRDGAQGRPPVPLRPRLPAPGAQQGAVLQAPGAAGLRRDQRVGRGRLLRADPSVPRRAPLLAAGLDRTLRGAAPSGGAAHDGGHPRRQARRRAAADRRHRAPAALAPLLGRANGAEGARPGGSGVAMVQAAGRARVARAAQGRRGGRAAREEATRGRRSPGIRPKNTAKGGTP